MQRRFGLVGAPRRFFGILSVCGLLLIGVSVTMPTQAQTPLAASITVPPTLTTTTATLNATPAADFGQPVLTGVSAGEIDWSAESKGFAVFNNLYDGQSDQPQWWAYSFARRSVSKWDSWPFSPNLTTREAAIIKPATLYNYSNSGTVTSPIFVSPNGRYLAYGVSINLCPTQPCGESNTT